MALTGSIWHSVALSNVNFQPFHLHMDCPLEVKTGTVVGTTLMGDQTMSTQIPPSAIIGLPAAVIMASRGMLSELDESEIAVIERMVTGECMIRDYADLGRFATENEALAVFAQHLRLKNKGKSRPAA